MRPRVRGTAVALLLLAACRDPVRNDAKPSSEPGMPAPAEGRPTAPEVQERALEPAPKSEPAPRPEPAQKQRPSPAKGLAQDATARTACVDAQLAARHLNAYGDPPDTMYAGGTPLFDERTGVARDRLEAVFAKHPQIARACDQRGADR